MSARPVIVHTLKAPRVEVGPADASTQLHPAMNQASSAPEKPLYVRTRAPEWLPQVLAPVIGLALFVALWAIIAKAGTMIRSHSGPGRKNNPRQTGIMTTSSRRTVRPRQP